MPVAGKPAKLHGHWGLCDVRGCPYQATMVVEGGSFLCDQHGKKKEKNDG